MHTHTHTRDVRTEMYEDDINSCLSCLSRWHATAAMPRDTVCCSGMMCSGVPPTGAMQRTAHTHSHACACVLSRMQKHTGASTLATT